MDVLENESLGNCPINQGKIADWVSCISLLFTIACLKSVALSPVQNNFLSNLSRTIVLVLCKHSFNHILSAFLLFINKLVLIWKNAKESNCTPARDLVNNISHLNLLVCTVCRKPPGIMIQNMTVELRNKLLTHSLYCCRTFPLKSPFPKRF